MVYTKSLKSYNRTRIETAGKMELVVMCYERAIQLLRQAKDHFHAGEINQKAFKMQKALDIINELQGCLNLQDGGQIAINLDSIYTYIIKRLLLGDIHKDITALDESIRLLDELKDAWDQIQADYEDRIDPQQAHDAEGHRLEQIAV